MEKEVIVLLSLVARLCSWVACEEADTEVIILDQSQSWGDGLRECHDRNGSLLSQEEAESVDWNTMFNGDQSEQELWTGMHQYQSDWLGAIGWVHDSSIRNVAEDTFEMDISSPGACQELCRTSLYAITNGSTCLCIPNSDGYSGFSIYTTRASSWKRCDNSETPNTCGGKQNDLDIASLYGDLNYLLQGVTVIETNGHCATARCSSTSGSPTVQGFDCQTNILYNCEQSTETSRSTWDQAYESCLNVSSLYVTQISGCLTFVQTPRMASTSYWVGLKRQNYTRSDRGDVEFNSVQKCQSCNTSGSCEFQTDCQSVKKLVPCKVPASDTPTTTLQTVYLETAATTSDQSTREIISAVKTPEDDFPLLLVLFAAIGGAVGILLLVISVVTCVRLRSKRNRKRTDNSVPNGGDATTQRQNTTNDLNLKDLNHRGQGDSDRDTYDHIESKGPTNGRGEGSKSDNQNIYHHLRTKTDRSDESESNMYDVSGGNGRNGEDIYNHLREGSSNELLSENEYDVGGCSGNEDPEIYNHLHSDSFVENSDNNYNMYGVN